MTTKITELSRIVELRAVMENDHVALKIKATPEECQMLAKRFDILDVEDLDASMTIRRGHAPGLIRIDGEIGAHVVQACSVTLAPVKETIEDTFSDVLTTDPALLATEEEAADDDSDKPVELIRGDTIDIGEIVAQWVALALNPYPRSDAPLYEHIEHVAEMGTHTPFDVLKALKEK